MKNEVTLKGLLEARSSDWVLNEANFLIIEVEIDGNKPEIIINPKENFKIKLEYYANSYNDDLTLKANSKIKIVKYVFVKSIIDYFNDIGGPTKVNNTYLFTR